MFSQSMSKVSESPSRLEPDGSGLGSVDDITDITLPS